MTCVFPLDAWHSTRLSKTGKRPVVFNPRDGYLDKPLQLPCGKCVGCTTDRAKTWSIRMHHESLMHDQNSFLTLTYSDPPPESISKRDLQLFFKRLRKRINFRYFACGEYGENTHRPHYHAIIFGHDFLGGAYQITDTLWGHPILDNTWSHGFHTIGSVSAESCKYVAGYVNKKIGDPDTFNLMSRKPGIGSTWLDQYHQDLTRNGKAVINGQQYAIPKRYLEWKPDTFEDIIKQRKNYFATLPQEIASIQRENLPNVEADLIKKQSLKAYTI